jgi:hypothetical protein
LPLGSSTRQTTLAGAAQVTNSRLPSGERASPEGEPGKVKRRVVARRELSKINTCLAEAQAM